MNAFPWPERVTIREVGLRDGLQSPARTWPTAHKLQSIESAHEAGIREIEVGSFVPPGRLPQLADTRGLGMANAMAALQAGETRFDACLAGVGGIGGCPQAPGASGHVATGDLACLLASMGIETGIDFGQIMALRAQLAQWLAGESRHGSIVRAGWPKSLRTPKVMA